MIERIGILDHADSSLGGAQLVVGHMAAILSRRYDVDIVHSGRGYSLPALAAAFELDLERVKERTVAGSSGSFNIPGAAGFQQSIARARTLTCPYDLFIYSGHGVPPFCSARRGLVYCLFPMELRPGEHVELDDGWKRRRRVDRWMRAAAYRLLWHRRMRRYEVILADSAFTARWVARRWGRSADVLYPPVDLEIPPAAKQDLIVSIGRFDGGSRTKNQLGQVMAFREFLEETSGDWRLRLIGSAEDPRYLRRVREAAEGLPVELLVDVDRNSVRASLAAARLFWHTTGHPADDEGSPDDAEHFGIATVEGMRAGCVPVVIASGGQREIIDDGVSGFLCGDLRQLVQRSVEIACDRERLHLMSDHARRGSQRFTREIFAQRLTAIVQELPTTGPNGMRSIDGAAAGTAEARSRAGL